MPWNNKRIPAGRAYAACGEYPSRSGKSSGLPYWEAFVLSIRKEEKE